MSETGNAGGEKRTSANEAKGSGAKDMASWKPGSEAEKAKDVAAAGDFGVPMGDGPSLERDYVTRNTKMSDPGAALPRAGEDPEGRRTSGAGAPASGDGSSSGGDIDTDIIGVGSGGAGIAEAGPDEELGAAETDGSSDPFASGGHAERRNQTDVHEHGATEVIRGSTVQMPDARTGESGQGADSVNNDTARGDDSFAGEISAGEASGDDEPLRPSDRT